MQLTVPQTKHTNEVHVWCRTKAITGRRGLFAGFSFARNEGRDFLLVASLVWARDGLHVSGYDSRGPQSSVIRFADKLAGAL